MNTSFSNAFLTLLIGLTLVNCANRGTPQGGPKDETPPVIIKSEPENFSTNFKGNEIRIYFDEFIKIKDLQKQLIISPPMKTQPLVTPMGSASKHITIKIEDTLKPNTTYAFNFGNSIVDNNEGNPYPYYRYVFSTGNYIDSLNVQGKILDALHYKAESFVNVGLYEVDSTFNDSIIYKEVPTYITNTLDSLTTFSIENIKPGKYMLMALKDKTGDNKFQQKTDQIGFYEHFITVPNDSLYTLRLFNEALDFKASRPILEVGQKITFGYQGDYKKMKIKLKSEVPADFDYRITKDAKTDTLYYWYKPKLEVDSLIFNVSHPTFEKDYTVKIRDKEKDSLILKPISTEGIDKPFELQGNVPIVKLDDSKVSIIDKDSTAIKFTSKFDTINNVYSLNFDKTEENSYQINILPNAIQSFFGKSNDTLKYITKTKAASSYGYARFTLVNATYPLIIQLTSQKGEVIEERYAKEEGTVDFYNLTPNTYYIRVIHDTNGNGKYDTGSYLEKRQPERVSHFDAIEIRADWGYPEILQFTE